MSRRNYIGLSNSVHDSSIAVAKADGEVVFAEGLERPLQNKRAWCCPPDYLMTIGTVLDRYCDPGAELVVANSWSKGYATRNRLFERLARVFNDSPSDELRAAKTDLLHITNGQDAAMTQFAKGIECRVASDRRWPAPLVRRNYEHHLTHAAAAAYASPFDEALCLVVDGFGESSSVSAFRYANHKVEKIRVRGSFAGVKEMMHGSVSGTSLGGFYSTVTYACGFDWFAGEEWKVMGLASYGRFDQTLYDLLRPMLRAHGLSLMPGQDVLERETKLRRLRRAKGVSPLESADLAYTAQYVFCEVYMELIENLFSLGGKSRNLVLSGGCALNSSANGMVVERTSFERLYVPCAPADDGNSIGAALLAFHEDHPRAPVPAPRVPYLGSKLNLEASERLQRFGGMQARTFEEQELCDTVARLIAGGKIVGWVQGAAEFGPRALGNRSILADPRRKDIKQLINERIKFREEFRPLAPSVLWEDGASYFENYAESPYMERTLRFKPAVVDKVPGVVHTDGTGRLQTVRREHNPRYYTLIKAFKALTGVPMLLNTSFNVMGRPMVHSVEDAIVVLLTTGIDVLVLENQLYEKDAVVSKHSASRLQAAPV